MADRFSKKKSDLDDPITNGFAVTPADATVFTQSTRALWIGGAGNVKVMLTDSRNANNVITLSGVNAGTLLPLRVQRVYSGNTTATLIVGLY